MSLTDEALRRRLAAAGFAAPPITESTRGVLAKKLRELEAGAKKKPSTAAQATARGGRRSVATSPPKLLEYSSGEDEEEEEVEQEEPRVLSRIRGRAAAGGGGGGAGGRAQRRAVANGRSTRMSANAMLSYSEDENESPEEEDAEEDEDEEEEDNEDEEQEDDEEEEDEADPSPSASRAPNGGLAHHNLRQRRTTTPAAATTRPSATRGAGGRFASVTPPSPRSTAAYAAASSGESSSSSPPPSPPPASSTPTGPFAAPPPAFRRGPPSGGRPFPFSNGGVVVTQAAPHTPSQSTRQQMRNQAMNQRRSWRSALREWSTPQSILATAALFLAAVGLKYASLRPSFDIENKLAVCGTPGHVSGPCVRPGEARPLALLHQRVLAVLEQQERDALCSKDSDVGGFNLTDAAPPSAMRQDEILEKLKAKREGEAEDEYEDARLLPKLVTLLADNSSWGVVVDRQQQQQLELLSLTYDSLDWSCWLSLRLERGLALCLAASGWVLSLGAAGAAGYVCLRLYRWQRDRNLRQRQEVFELVEQALSLLVAQQQVSVAAAAGRSPPGVVVGPGPPTSPPPPWVAVSHVRDQLIPPQERKRRRRTWEMAAKYIREQESRVREDVRRVYGEEHRVWQWVPELHWSPPHHPAAPNPFLVSPQAMQQMSPVFGGHLNKPPFATPPPSLQQQQQQHRPPLASPPPGGGGGGGSWQGSAFASLSKNVAAPSVAPTACLKVRHLFDAQSQRTPGWVVQVKEELLRRCASGRAAILHVAVDTESGEGCVYVKCASTDDALKVFRALHGQWYRGQLVTAKYLREERYHERFPDARNHRVPMRL